MRKVLAALLLLSAVFVIWAQTYNLAWGAFTNGGTEFPNGRWSSSYRLADNIGRGTSSTDTVLSDGVNYDLYPGYRYVELDLRYPISWIDSTDTITHSPSFVITWEGVDTTHEDGEGWGLRYYDVDYAVNDSSVWNSWFTGVTFTTAIFGPSSPVVVKEDTVYFFRVKAYDYATNEEPEHTPFDQKVIYQSAPIEFFVYNPTSGHPVWSADTFDPGQTVSMNNSDVLIVENQGVDTLTLAVRAFPVGYDTLNHRSVWALADYAGKDTFAIRAEFDDNTASPVTFGSSDIVADTFTFTDAGTGHYGGPAHGVLYANTAVPADSLQYSDKLWLQIHLPTAVTSYGDTTVYRFTVQLKARANP